MMEALESGGRIGILGTGQLGRMLATAAAKLGLRTIVYGPDQIGPARSTARSNRFGTYDDEDALTSFALECDVITYELEHLPLRAIDHLARTCPVYPRANALAIAQDRLYEKNFLNDNNIPLAPYVAIESEDDLQAAAQQVGLPLILKTRRFGYDGKGQTKVERPDDLIAGWQRIGRKPAVAEAVIDFEREISAIIARSSDGSAELYALMDNEHRDHILHHTQVPATLDPDRCHTARAVTRRIAEGLDYVGVLTVEMFVTQDGLLVNELAPRVHNSGHWTIEGAITSQFEQHIRAVANLPLGKPDMLGPSRMLNLVAGRSELDLATLLSDPQAHVHLYGKREAKPGRKMGHVTWVTSS